jgi:hypothetical protein
MNTRYKIHRKDVAVDEKIKGKKKDYRALPFPAGGTPLIFVSVVGDLERTSETALFTASNRGLTRSCTSLPTRVAFS